MKDNDRFPKLYIFLIVQQRTHLLSRNASKIKKKKSFIIIIVIIVIIINRKILHYFQ